MGHLGTGKADVFRALAERLDRNPVGAPLSDTLMRILKIMYSEQEAEIGSRFPPGFTTADRLASATGLPTAEILRHLDHMTAKGLVVDVPGRGRTLYALSPLVVGFFEYTFMRVTNTLPLRELAELFERYHHEPGVAEEFFGAETKMFQTWAYESLMPAEVETEVLTYEKASAMIRDAGGGSLSMCYCRHQALHRGKSCGAPVHDVCTSLGRASEWLIRRGFARPASVDQLLRVLEKTEALGLVHLADNVRNNPAYICHCCGCCCGVLRSINEHGVFSVHPSNFLPRIDEDSCMGCGECVGRCHVGALRVMRAVPGDPASEKAVVSSKRCLGCGACVGGCAQNALSLVRRDRLHLPPADKREQLRRIAREKGKNV